MNNYLDYIPKYNHSFSYREKENQHIEVEVLHQGFFARIAQLFFKKPARSYIELDDLGSFVWRQINAKRSIYEIGQLLKAEYGEKAEPLYERLSDFFGSLKNNYLILYENKSKK